MFICPYFMILALFRKLCLLDGKFYENSIFDINCSCYAYLEKRYNHQVRQFASFLFFIYVVMMNPLLVYTPSLAFSQVSGINLHYITPILVIVCIFYTTFGGLRFVNIFSYQYRFLMKIQISQISQISTKNSHNFNIF